MPNDPKNPKPPVIWDEVAEYPSAPLPSTEGMPPPTAYMSTPRPAVDPKKLEPLRRLAAKVTPLTPEETVEARIGLHVLLTEREELIRERDAAATALNAWRTMPVLEEARALLREVDEKARSAEDVRCPICDSPTFEHRRDCRLAAFLRP